MFMLPLLLYTIVFPEMERHKYFMIFCNIPVDKESKYNKK